MLKKLLLGLAMALALVLVAVAALVMMVDVNRFKPQIAAFVQDHYQRRLVIDGDLALSVWPNIAVALPAMSLSEPRAEPVAMKLSSARVSVRLMPLLSGRLQADVIRVAGLDATIVRRADGSLSIDDLIGGGEATGQPAPPSTEQGGSGSGPIALDSIELGGLQLTDARVVFDDRQAGNRIELSDLNLSTGALADRRDTTVSLTANANVANPKVAVSIDLTSQLAIALAEQQVDAKTLELLIKGKLDGMPLNQRVTAAGLHAGASAVRADSIRFGGDLDQGARRLAYELGSPLTMNLTDGSIALGQLAGQFSLDDRAVAPEPIVVPIKGAIKANTKQETVSATLDLAARDVTLKASADVKGFARPAIGFDIQADRIDVDRFLPPSAPTAGPAPTGTPVPAPTDTPIDLSALNSLDLDGRVRIGELIAAGARLARLDVSVKTKGGVATLAPLSAQLYEGSLNGRASVAATGNRISLTSELVGVQIGPLLTDLADTDLLTGQGNVTVDVRTAGPTVNALKQALTGKASLRLADGAVKGINLGERIRDVEQLLSVGKAETVRSSEQARTDFTALTASFDIVDGVASNTDLDGRSPLFRLDGSGKVSIAAGTIDYLARASVVGTAKGQGGRNVDELRGVTIPVRLTGPFDQLAWAIDWSAAAKEALKSRAAEQLGVDQAAIDAKKAELKAKADAEEARLRERAKLEEDKARDRLKAEEQKLKDKAAEKIGEKLKGLFN